MWLSLITAIPGLLGKGFDYFSKKADIGLEKYRIDGVFNIEAMKQDVEVKKIQAQLNAVYDTHVFDRIARYLFEIPTGLWYTAIIIDCIAQKIFGWHWDVLALPDQVAFIPYVIIGFLFLYRIKK